MSHKLDTFFFHVKFHIFHNEISYPKTHWVLHLLKLLSISPCFSQNAQYFPALHAFSGFAVLTPHRLSEPEFYGDLVYKFRKIIGKNDFPYHFKKIVVRYKKIGYNIDVLRQTSCLVVNPIKVNSFAYLFNCTTVGRASD